MNPTEVGDIVHHGFANYDERFSEVLVLLVAHSRIKVSLVPPGEKFQVPVKRSYRSFVQCMIPIQANDLKQELQGRLEPDLIVVDAFVPIDRKLGPHFVMHKKMPVQVLP